MKGFWRPSEHEVTLRATMNRVLLIVLGLVIISTMGILFGYAEIKQTVAIRELVTDLAKATPAQIEALIPSFLVPEQRSGAAVLLNRFKASGDLDEIKIMELHEKLPATLSRCALTQEPSDCIERVGKRIAYIAPIREGDQTFGYLVKIKRFSNPLAADSILQMIEGVSIVLVLVFLALFIVFSRITVREIPDELSNLAAWVESVLADKSSAHAPKLRFKELNDLAGQIAKILERHELARDQAVVGQLTSGIMHDLRTPIHPIVSAYGLAAEQAEGTPKKLQRLENLFRACSANLPIIGSLIESTLDGSRNIHIEPELLDLRETFRQALALQAQAVAHRHLKVEITSGDTPVVVPHDPVQMGRVFANVLKNSMDAIDEARQADAAHPAHFHLAITKTPSGVSIRMEDSGLGLPADPEKVFRAFRSSKPRGSGLGLMISRKIVEAHGGRMLARRSERLAGASFEVLLPIDGAAVRMEAKV